MRYDVLVKWATVTVVEKDGRRHSLDVQADSTFDAAHLFLAAAKGVPPDVLSVPIPIPTTETVFEVSVSGKVHKVTGSGLQKWILKQRSELGGPRGYLFSKRPILD